MYNVVLPESLALCLHLPSHITTLSPSRPLPPPILPPVWLSWLQTHWLALGPSLDHFLERECEVPVAEAVRETLKVSYIPSLLPSASLKFLATVRCLAGLAGDSQLMERVEGEVGSRANNLPEALPMLRGVATPNLLAYMIR